IGPMGVSRRRPKPADERRSVASKSEIVGYTLPASRKISPHRLFHSGKWNSSFSRRSDSPPAFAHERLSGWPGGAVFAQTTSPPTESVAKPRSVLEPPAKKRSDSGTGPVSLNGYSAPTRRNVAKRMPCLSVAVHDPRRNTLAKVASDPSGLANRLPSI